MSYYSRSPPPLQHPVPTHPAFIPEPPSTPASPQGYQRFASSPPPNQQYAARTQYNPPKHYTISVFLQHAWSRGHVHATSSSVLDSPEIDSAMLDSPGNIDMMLLLEAVKYAFKIMKTGALGDLTAEIIEPNPSWSDEQLMDYIRSNVDSGLHPIGTASMLPRSANGVVDNELKVYGTTNLRVADASILPIHLGTHPQATLYGLAHKAAEFIQTSEKAKL